MLAEAAAREIDLERFCIGEVDSKGVEAFDKLPSLVPSVDLERLQKSGYDSGVVEKRFSYHTAHVEISREFEMATHDAVYSVAPEANAEGVFIVENWYGLV